MVEQIASDAQDETTRINNEQGGQKAILKQRSDISNLEKGRTKPQSKVHNTWTHAGIIKPFKPPAQIKNAKNCLDFQAEHYGTCTQFTSLRLLEAAKRKRLKGMENMENIVNLVFWDHYNSPRWMRMYISLNIWLC